jgi:hypothetical protein
MNEVRVMNERQYSKERKRGIKKELIGHIKSIEKQKDDIEN